MPSHPVYQIIHSLDESTRKEVEKYLLTGSRSEKLFMVLAGSPEFLKEKVFKKIFKKTYTKTQDYLLRNELSLLRRKIEKFLLRQEENRRSDMIKNQDDYILAKWFIELKLPVHAIEKIKKVKKTALENEDWPLLFRLNALENSASHFYQVGAKERIEALQQRINEHRVYARKQYQAEMAYAAYLKGLQIKLQKIESKNTDTWEDGELNDADATETEAYFFYKGLGYAAENLGSVPLLQKAVRHLEKLPSTHERNSEWFSCIGQIASEYSAAGDFLSAEAWFERIMASPDLERYTHKGFLVLNYVVTLVKLKKYREALKWIHVMEKPGQESYMLDRLRIAKVSCYMFLKDTKNLKRTLPKDFSNMDIEFRHYYRMQYSIYFYLSGNLESAEREMLNLQRNTQLQEKPYEDLTDLFLQFYSFMMSHPDLKPSPQKMGKIKKAFADFKDHTAEDVKAMVPAIWLMEEWEEVQKKQ